MACDSVSHVFLETFTIEPRVLSMDLIIVSENSSRKYSTGEACQTGNCCGPGFRMKN